VIEDLKLSEQFYFKMIYYLYCKITGFVDLYSYYLVDLRNLGVLTKFYIIFAICFDYTNS